MSQVHGDVPPLDPLPFTPSSLIVEYLEQLRLADWLQKHEQKNREANPTLRDQLSDQLRFSEAAGEWLREQR